MSKGPVLEAGGSEAEGAGRRDQRFAQITGSAEGGNSWLLFVSTQGVCEEADSPDPGVQFPGLD